MGTTPLPPSPMLPQGAALPSAASCSATQPFPINRSAQMKSAPRLSSSTRPTVASNSFTLTAPPSSAPVRISALSPNGLGLAVVHADAIEIYNLPPLTDKDAAALKLAQASAPTENNLPVRFTAQTTAPTDSDVDSDSAATPPNPQQPTTPAAANAPHSSQPAPAASSQPASSNTETQSSPTGSPTPTNRPSGDTAPEEHRAPPTLYTLPTDKPPSNPKEPQQ